MIGEVCHQLLQAWLSANQTAQTLRPFIRLPRLRDVTVGHDIATTHIEAASYKLKFSNRSLTFGSQRNLFTAACHGATALCCLRLWIAKWAPSAGFDKIERTGDQAHAIAVVATQLHSQRETIANFVV